jgi:tRNA G18 (ribose-2'-O)-methylase SpoU
MSRDVRILLHDIRSVYNAGAIFRTADAIGASRIYLSGFTPAPVDRFGQPRQDFAKCALGSEKTVAWEYMKSPARIIAALKKEGFQVVALEQTPDSIDYKKLKPALKCFVIFGNEVSGVSKNLLKTADIVAEIPMRGLKESLNVSVSAGIALFRWFDRGR